ncbi:MAG: alkaline phosphatase [Lachnospirales bacterium]
MKLNKILFSGIGILTAGVILCNTFIPSVIEEVHGNNINTTAETYGNYSTPKYVFLFIGDGMTYPQIQIASDYLGVKNMENDIEILEGGEPLSFMNFDVVGTATTYDSTSFCPDSASTATSISTGHKTYSGVINMDETLTTCYETIAETLKKEYGYKIGIVSSVNLNHATPAAFYAHQPKRSNYYEISEELIASDFEYFAGGALLAPTGNDEDRTNIYELAKNEGYTIATTTEEISKINANDEKVIITNEELDSSYAMPYAIDQEDDDYTLRNHVEKGIEILDNENGFFMMVEGGKIDWAGHANDAGTVVLETLDLSLAVEEAVEFYNEHPTETLIIVTGDHETGGLTIGYAGTNYDTYLNNLSNQEISYDTFAKEYASKYVTENTSFEEVMIDVENLFGLKMPLENSYSDDTLVLTDYEISTIKAGFEKTMSGHKSSAASEEEYVLYGSYDPLTVAITSVLNNKSGIAFTSFSHTGLPVGVFAQGVGDELFNGYYDNTDIYNKLISLFK